MGESHQMVVFLVITNSVSQRLTQPLGSFEHVWAPYDTEQVDASYRLRNPQTEIAQVPKIQSILTRSLVTGASEVVSDAAPNSNEGPDHNTLKPDPKIEKAAAALTNSLKSYNRSSLRFVAYSLGLDITGPNSKPNWAAKLTAWVSLMESAHNARLI
jgi:hypothetical protein